MTNYDEVNEYALELNKIYDEKGFDGIIKEVECNLEYGEVTYRNGLYCITTGGWSEDEFLLDALISPVSKFHYHYCGYLIGGAFFFDKDKSREDIDIIKFEEKGEEMRSIECGGKTENYTVRLSSLIKMALDIKALALYPSSVNFARDKLYNQLTGLEYQLVMLKDVNVELERDWWEE